MTREMALRYWAGRLREALGRPVKMPILTDHGVRAGYRLPDPEEQARALGMTVPALIERLAGHGLTAWDVAAEYVGGTARPFKVYVGPG